VIELQMELAALVPPPSDELKESLDRKELVKAQQRITRQEQNDKEDSFQKPSFYREHRLQRAERQEQQRLRQDGDEEWTDSDNFKPRHIKRQQSMSTYRAPSSFTDNNKSKPRYDTDNDKSNEPKNRKERRAEQFAHLRRNKRHEKSEHANSLDNFLTGRKKPTTTSKLPFVRSNTRFSTDDSNTESINDERKPKNRKEKRALKHAKLAATTGKPDTYKKKHLKKKTDSADEPQQRLVAKKPRWSESKPKTTADNASYSNKVKSKGSNKSSKSYQDEDDSDDDLDEGFEDTEDSQVFRRMAGRMVDINKPKTGTRRPSGSAAPEDRRAEHGRRVIRRRTLVLSRRR